MNPSLKRDGLAVVVVLAVLLSVIMWAEYPLPREPLLEPAEPEYVTGIITRLYTRKPDRGDTWFMVALNSTASYRVAESDWIRIEEGLTVTLEKGDYGVWKLTEPLK